MKGRETAAAEVSGVGEGTTLLPPAEIYSGAGEAGPEYGAALLEMQLHGLTDGHMRTNPYH